MYVRCFGLLATLAFAMSTSAADLGAATFSDLHIRPTQSKVGVAFFTVTSAKNDAIISVASDCCKAVELHRNEKINGNMTMRRIAQLSLHKKLPMQVQPGSKGGEHLMLIGLKKPLEEGDEVSITFTFDKAGDQTVHFPVLVKDE